MRQISEAGTDLFNYATYYSTSFTSLYSFGVEQASELYTAYTHQDYINYYRENLGQLILAGSLVMIGASFSTSIVPALVVKLATANTLSYSAKYLANYLSSLPSDQDKPNNEYWNMLIASLNALSDNIVILSSVMFLGSNIGSGLFASVGNHASLVTSSLGVVLARTIGFELNKMKDTYLNLEDDLIKILENKGSNLDFFKNYSRNIFNKAW